MSGFRFIWWMQFIVVMSEYFHKRGPSHYAFIVILFFFSSLFFLTVMGGLPLLGHHSRLESVWYPLFYITCIRYSVNQFKVWFCCSICLSVLGEGSLLCSSSWGSTIVFPLFRGFSFQYGNRINGLRTEDVHGMGCKAHWGNVTVILGNINKADLIRHFIFKMLGRTLSIMVMLLKLRHLCPLTHLS